ncbi:MAG: metallophosphoesterase family protein [Bacteroidia bacterium]|nr:metallophosphoesterase family protein [Bacteroidia bacterium]
MRKIVTCFIILFGFVAANAQKLNFNNDGSFKIAQFTDVHYVHGNSKSDTALLAIQRVLDAEKPDMVIFTGDVVTGRPVKEGWDAITKPVIDRKIPFAVTLGNHDDENGATRMELEKLITGYPYNCNYPTAALLNGVMNNVIPVYGSEKDMQVKSLIYCFDSGAYSTMRDVPGYGWITTDIIDWYKKQSLHFTKQNNFEPLPALAYFHIPLPEYRLAFNDENNKRVGVRKENECPPDLNTGMFIAMKEMRDVMATFVGHDHVNDYIVNYYDIALAYGQFTGWRTTYVSEMNGARIVQLKEGKREFDTWIRLLDGSVKYKVAFPSDLVTEKKK